MITKQYIIHKDTYTFLGIDLAIYIIILSMSLTLNNKEVIKIHTLFRLNVN